MAWTLPLPLVLLALRLMDRRRRFTSAEALRAAVAADRRHTRVDPPAALARRCRVAERRIGAQRCLTLTPPTVRHPAQLTYVHGGGHVAQISPYHWRLLGQLAETVGCTVHVPLYPLAPEHAHPAAFAMLDALYAEQVAQHGAEHCVWMGDSSGGGLALVIAQRAVARGLPAVRDLIRYYTREAGVRTLEREVARLARKALRKILEGAFDKVEITPENLADYAGVRKFRHGVGEEENQIGAVTGLAWTEVGGDLLTIEAVTVPGKGLIKTTGKLGEVMNESVQAAFSYVKARSPGYGIKPSLFNRKDIHIHLPEGAVPKDGPSAGIGMVTTIVSTLTGIPVHKDVAMTGEVTLRGRVLPIGGLKEKLLAALRGGIKTVLIPQENEKDLAEIPANIREGLEIVPVSHVDEVLARALVSKPEAITWTEEDDLAAQPSAGQGRDGDPAIRH